MNKALRAVMTVVILSASAPTPAVMPVIDAQSVLQLRQQIAYWQQQLDSMRSQSQTLRSQLLAATGTRGMGALLGQSTDQRNYLPTTDALTDAALAGRSRQYPALRDAYARHLGEQSILPEDAVARLSTSDQAVVREHRSAVAATESLFANALETASVRYRTLQALIDQIDRSADSKAILDLAGRMAGEQLMLENERIKLSSMATWAGARTSAATRRAAETALAEQGVFSSRFHPAQR